MEKAYKMKALFKKYMDAGMVSEALMVGQNMVNRNIDDEESFALYFDLIMSLAENSEEINQERFVGQATGLLAYFAENAELNEEKVAYIKRKEIAIDNAKKTYLKRKLRKMMKLLIFLESLCQS